MAPASQRDRWSSPVPIRAAPLSGSAAKPISARTAGPARPTASVACVVRCAARVFPSGRAHRSSLLACLRRRPCRLPSTSPRALAGAPRVACAASVSTRCCASPCGPASTPKASPMRSCGTSPCGRCKRTKPVEIAYATVHTERDKGPVVRVAPRVVLGTPAQVEATLRQGTTAKCINRRGRGTRSRRTCCSMWP
jgi:hypothetical protein